MPTFRLPLIQPYDYDAFRGLMHSHIPSTYDEWFQLHTKEVNGFVMRGHRVDEIKIDPNEFAGFCRGQGRAYDSDSLQRYVEEVSGD